jgi:hypothetical protein
VAQGGVALSGSSLVDSNLVAVMATGGLLIAGAAPVGVNYAPVTTTGGVALTGAAHWVFRVGIVRRGQIIWVLAAPAAQVRMTGQPAPPTIIIPGGPNATWPVLPGKPSS